MVRPPIGFQPGNREGAARTRLGRRLSGVSAWPIRARVPRHRPGTGERPQNSDDGEEKNGMASLVVDCRKTVRAAFYSALGCGYLSASVGRRAAAEVSAMEQLLLDDPLRVTDRGRLHSPAKAENSQFVLNGAEVVKPACFREAIGNPNTAWKAR
jgi:hypothetical protein